jgi:hypothetical protein
MASLAQMARQPQVAAGIDWANPITRGLLFAACPGMPVNLVDGVALANLSSGILLSSGARGRMLAAGAYGYPEPATAAAPEAKLDRAVLTAFVLAQQESPENADLSFFRGNGSSNPGWGVGLHSGSFNGAFAQIGSYAFSPSDPDGSLNLKPRAVTLTGDGANARVYFEGALVGSGAYSAPSYQYSPGSSRQVFLGAMSATSGVQTVRPFVGLFWNRVLSDAEVASISANPWQVFAPPRPRVLAAVASGGALSGAAFGLGAAGGFASLRASVSVAAAGGDTAGGAAGAGVRLSASAVGLDVASGTAGTKAIVTIGALGLAQAAGQAGLSAAVLLAAAGAAQASGNATLGARLQAMASGAAVAGGAAVLTGGAPGALAAVGGDQAGGAAVLVVSVQLGASGGDQAGGAAGITGGAPGQIAAAGGDQAAGSASLKVSVKLTAAGFVQAMGAGALVVSVPLSASGADQAGGSASAQAVNASFPIIPARAGYTVSLTARAFAVRDPSRQFVVR